MARYRFAVSEEQYGHAYFDADTYEQALELLELVNDGEIDPHDLPNSHVKINNGQCTYENLAEVEI